MVINIISDNAFIAREAVLPHHCLHDYFTIWCHSLHASYAILEKKWSQELWSKLCHSTSSRHQQELALWGHL